MFLARFVAFGVLLVGCQSVYVDGAPNENISTFLVPVQSRLVLHEAVTIPAEEIGAYLQYGTVIAWQQLRRYAPYCVLTREAPYDQLFTVKPGEFVVTDVARARRFYLPQAPMPPAAAQPAALRFTAATPGAPRSRGNYSASIAAEVMTLHSAAQPQVRQLMCANSGTPEERHTPSVRIIRETLGTLFTLELAAPRATRETAQ